MTEDAPRGSLRWVLTHSRPRSLRAEGVHGTFVIYEGKDGGGWTLHASRALEEGRYVATFAGLFELLRRAEAAEDAAAFLAPPCALCQAREHGADDCPHGDDEGDA